MRSISKFMLIAIILGLAVSAFAATVKNVELKSDAVLNGTTLKAGSYKVSIDGEGANVKVSFMQGNKVIATSDAKLVDNGAAPEFSAVVRDTKNSIQELRIAGLKSKVVFNQ